MFFIQLKRTARRWRDKICDCYDSAGVHYSGCVIQGYVFVLNECLVVIDSSHSREYLTKVLGLNLTCKHEINA